jgi:hypothetical protein
MVMKLSSEQKLLLFAISHQYVLLNNDGEIEDDVKRALCGTFNANKKEYKIPDLVNDIESLEGMRLIEKNFKEKRFDASIEAKTSLDIVTFDNSKENAQYPPEYTEFMKVFWMVFCSFLKGPLLELLKVIYESESKQLSDLKISSDIAAGVLCDLGIKRGFIEKDPKGGVILTENGISMVEAALKEEAANG